MIVCDTGPIVALSNHRGEHHYAANNLFRDLHMPGETLLLPPTVLAEVCYWLNEHGGPDVEAAFLDSVVDGTFQLVDLTAEDVERMAELVRQFASIAERLGTREIATLDRRHFPSITPKDGGHFTLLPETLP